jgi:uncharacterized membrane protein
VVDEGDAGHRAEHLRAFEGQGTKSDSRTCTERDACETVPMETRRWINHSLPQTLANAVLLLYISGAFDLLLGGLGILLAAGKVAAGYGIANEKKWGYNLAVIVAFLVVFGALTGFLPGGLLSLLFDVVLVALLLHDQSREHQRVWFD